VLLAALGAACSDEDPQGASEGEPDSESGESAPHAGPVSDDCPASTTNGTGYPAEGYGEPRSLTVCLYQKDDSGALRATWSDELGPEPAAQVVRAVALGPRTDCPAAGPGDSQQVLLRVQTENDFGSKPLTRDYLMHLDGCPSVVDLTESDLRGGPASVGVTGRMFAPWVGEELASHLESGSLPDEVASYLEPSES
jgi:hypothetical protein